jgi:hypothetical protein
MAPFASEAEMTSAAREADRTWWRGRHPPCVVAGEVVGPDAIADLVGARFDAVALSRRDAAGVRPVTDQLALRAVLASRRAHLTTRDLAEACKVTPSGMRRGIVIALDAGALIEVSRFRYTANPGWSPVVRRAVALELKLRDWSRALRQAIAYRSWANAAWILLARRPSNAALSAASTAGVGLGTLTPDGAATAWLRPEVTSRTTHWSSIWVGEQLLAAARLEAPDPCVEMSGPRLTRQP